MDLYSIYPKQFKQSKITIISNQCFVLMPFDKKYDELYGIIKDELKSLSIGCWRDDEITGSQPFMNKVITKILESRYVIVILTDYRPNVLYELGIAHCFKDIQNVLLLIEKGAKINHPINKDMSDISHLTYVEYDIENPLMLKTHIRKFVEKNKSTLDFQEFLIKKEIMPLITENNNNFIFYIESKLDKLFSAFTQILNDPIEFGIEEKQEIVELVLNKYQKLLYNEIDNKSDNLDLVLKIYAELLITVSQLGLCEGLISGFINDEFIRPVILDESNKNQLKIDFIVYLASQNKFLNLLLPWIIEYFKKTKSSSIDLNRYKLESFLINSENNQVNEAICNALREPDFHIREHLSDIIGEKRLKLAYHNLINALGKEKSLYAGKSMIVALGKIGDGDNKDAAELILNWLKLNIKNILNAGTDFTNSILTKSRQAIGNLYSSLIKAFDSEFGKNISNMDY